jgi:hypothetical protein
MLVGFTPFHASSEFLTFQAIDSYLDGSHPIEFPSTPNMSPHAQDIIAKFLIAAPSSRLGSGEADAENGINAIKNHLFFRSTSWGNLINETAPYQPDQSTFPSSESLRDGADNDWIFDGEATPILHNSDKLDNRGGKDAKRVKKPSASTDSSSSSSSSSSVGKKGIFRSNSSIKNPPENVFLRKNVDQFLLHNEKQIFTGIVYKRKVNRF